jgi:hypothetical protein
MNLKAADRAKLLAKIVAALNLLMILLGFILHIGFSTYSRSDIEFWFELFTYMTAALYSVLAVLIIVRNPRNTIGWLFLVVGFFSSIPVLNEGALLEGLLDSELFRGLYAWVGHLIWIPAYLIPITLALQFFPDGRLPSKRWWPVPAATVIGLLGYTVSIAFYPWPWVEQDILETNNPFGIAGSEAFFSTISEIAFFFMAVGIVGTLGVVVARYRQARGIERQQIKWLVYTAVVSISVLILQPRMAHSTLSDLFFRSLPTIFALVMGLAILRYRLFDIDIIIRKTIVYGLVSALLALVYFGSVVLLQDIFENVSGEKSALSIVISTLLIAALFSPLRRRIQEVIDRRFYRRKYDAQQVLAQFGQTAVDDVDMGNLAEDLIGVVEKTLQPDRVSLWLKQPGRQPKSQGLPSPAGDNSPWVRWWSGG